MWHRKRRRRLGVKTKHRKALLRNIVRSLVLYRSIETTLARAKEASRLADQMVTLAKKGTLHARRQMIADLGSADTAKIFIDQIAPRLKDRQGGYTRILKMDKRRGDGGQAALLEFSVPIEFPKQERKPRKEKPKTEAKPAEKTSKPKGAEAEAKPAEKGKDRDTEKRGGFLSKLRKFLTGDEEK